MAFDNKDNNQEEPMGVLARMMMNQNSSSSNGQDDWADMDEDEFFAQLNEQAEENMRRSENEIAMGIGRMTQMIEEPTEGASIVPDIGTAYVPDFDSPVLQRRTPSIVSSLETMQPADARIQAHVEDEPAPVQMEEETVSKEKLPMPEEVPADKLLTPEKSVTEKLALPEEAASEKLPEFRERKFDTVLVLPEEEMAFAAAARALAEGEVVGMPTETVYGLGCNALMPEAVAKVYEAKGRPSDNPLIVHIASKDMIPQLTSEVSPVAQALIDAFMPGPITIIMKKAPIIPDVVTAGRDTVGIRFPIHPIAQQLIAQSGVPVAAPSANLSGSPSPTKSEHVMKDMDGRIPYIIEGGECQVGLESTVVDATGNWPQILRPGAVTMSLMEEVMAQAGIEKPQEVIQRELQPGEAPMAPGMKYRHYAPSCEVKILGEGDFEEYTRYYKEAVMRAIIDGNTPVGLFAGKEITHMVHTCFPDKLDEILIFEYGEMTDVYAASHGLFDGLRTLDEEGAKVIYAPGFPEEEMGVAYMNRLNKAAAGKKEGMGKMEETLKTTRKVMFVCSGNTCRSPLAEAILRYLWKKSAPHKLIDRPDQEVTLEVSSAGLNAESGSPYTLYSIRLANYEFNEDLTQGEATQLTGNMLMDKDLVLCMTKDHSRKLRFHYPDYCKHVFALQELLDDLYIPGITGEVQDPYGQEYLVYKKTGDQLKTILTALLPEILKQWGVS